MATAAQCLTTPFWPPMAALAADMRPMLKALSRPATEALKRRNIALDWLFYDIGNLTPAEFAWLSTEVNQEGSILVVWPTGSKGDVGVLKFEDHGALRAAPGALLARFAVAGVGSSDVGAAAFARTVADRYQEPVGAIVAGYGVDDLLSEALGGWFVLGAANRLLMLLPSAEESEPAVARTLEHKAEDASPAEAHAASKIVTGRDDSETLLRLMLDGDRRIKSVAGHSKGCLSIAYAIEALALLDDAEAVARAKAMRITTAGAVVALPPGYGNVGQYLGAIDGFGRLNSRSTVARSSVAGAWHHLNTTLPFHMDFAAVLADEPD